MHGAVGISARSICEFGDEGLQTEGGRHPEGSVHSVAVMGAAVDEATQATVGAVGKVRPLPPNVSKLQDRIAAIGDDGNTCKEGVLKSLL